jgi:hypothetical protein
MKFKKFNAREKEIYIQAKIRVYYDMKKKQKDKKIKTKLCDYDIENDYDIKKAYISVFGEDAYKRHFGKTR